MQQEELYKSIISELRAYKHNKCVLETLEDECLQGVSAQQLSEVPRSITNKFSSMTENQAFRETEDMELIKDIKRVNRWLKCLTDEEKYMIENFYIESRTYNTIIHNWRIEHTIDYWRKKRISGLNCICNVLIDSENRKRSRNEV